MQKMYKLDVHVLCTSAILIPSNLCIKFLSVQVTLRKAMLSIELAFSIEKF